MWVTMEAYGRWMSTVRILFYILNYFKLLHSSYKIPCVWIRRQHTTTVAGIKWEMPLHLGVPYRSKKCRI